MLPSDTNRAEIEVLTLNVILSVNLVGRWQTPDGSFVIQNSLSLPIFYLSDEGLYKFYVTDWNGEQELAIQIEISVLGKCICYNNVLFQRDFVCLEYFRVCLFVTRELKISSVFDYSSCVVQHGIRSVGAGGAISPHFQQKWY